MTKCSDTPWLDNQVTSTIDNMKISLDKIKYHPIWHRYRGLPLCLAVSLLSQVLALGFKFLFLPLFPEGGLIDTMITNFKEDWYINSFYTEINASRDVVTGNDDIMIVDIKDSFSNRKHIADVIKTISLQKPAIICIDFFFDKTDSYDAEKSQYLLETLKEIKDSTKIVVVSYKGNDEEICHSFFMDSLLLDYGLSDFYGFYQYVPYISDTIPRISTKVAEMMGVDVKNMPHPLVINYRNKEFRRRAVIDSLDLDYSIRGMKDKIVLVGKYNAMEDIHNTPFLINGLHQISGIEIIAFEISSLMSYAKKERSLERYPYTILNTLWTFIIGFLVSLAYVFFLRKIILSPLSKPLITITKTVYLIATEIFIVFICFAITEAYMIIPSILFFVTSIIFVDVLLEILNDITQKSNRI